MSARGPLAQTLIDGQHEWRRAANGVQRVAAVARLIAALARVLVLVTCADAGRAMRTPFIRQWIVGTTLVSTGSWLAIPWLLHRRGPAHFYLVDLGEIFVMLMMPAFVLLSLMRRRSSTLPRVGTLAVVVGVVLAWFLILLPVGYAARYTAFSNGVLYAPVPWLMTTQFVMAHVLLAWTMIGLTDRVIVHERRPFLSALSLLLPIASIIFTGMAADELRPMLVSVRILPHAAFAVAAAGAIALLWGGLVWESRTNVRGVANALR